MICLTNLFISVYILEEKQSTETSNRSNVLHQLGHGAPVYEQRYCGKHSFYGTNCMDCEERPEEILQQLLSNKLQTRYLGG